MRNPSKFSFLVAAVQLVFVLASATAWAGSIQGFVKDEQGQPIEGAKVEIAGWWQGSPTDTTDSTGEYKLDNVGQGQYHVVATKAGYARTYHPRALADWRGDWVVVTAQNNDVTGTNITMGLGGSLSGFFTSTSGLRLDVANVQVVMRSERSDFDYTVQTKADPTTNEVSFLFEYVPVAADLWIAPEGLSASGVDYAAAANGPFEVKAGQTTAAGGLKLPGNPATIRGTVKDAQGNPLQPSHINLWGRSSDGKPLSSWVLNSWNSRAKLQNNPQNPADGWHYDGFHVSWNGQFNSGSGGSDVSVSPTGEYLIKYVPAGRFELNLHNGNGLDMDLDGDGTTTAYGSITIEGLLASAGGNYTVNIVLAPAGTILNGILREAGTNGQPINYANLNFEADAGTQTTPDGQKLRRRYNEWVTTQSLGQFEVRYLTPAPNWAIRMDEDSSGFYVSDNYLAENVVISSGDNHQFDPTYSYPNGDKGKALRAIKGAKISGKVIKPLSLTGGVLPDENAGVFMGLIAFDASAPLRYTDILGDEIDRLMRGMGKIEPEDPSNPPDPQANPNGNGKYEAAFGPGQIDLSLVYAKMNPADDDDFPLWASLWGTKRFSVAPGQILANQDYGPGSSGTWDAGRLMGMVTAEDGGIGDWSTAMVGLLRGAGRLAGIAVIVDDPGNAGIGRYELERLEAGDYTIFAVHQDYAVTSKTIKVGTTGQTVVDLVLSKGGTLQGKVIKSKANAADPDVPIEGAIVEAGPKLVRTDANGEWSLSLQPGKYAVAVRASGYAPAKDDYGGALYEVKTGQTTATATLQLRSNVGTISGTVKDDQGNPIAGAKVVVLTSENKQKFEASSGSDGSWLVEGLLETVITSSPHAPLYKVGVSAQGYRSAVKTTGTPPVAVTYEVEAGKNTIGPDFNLDKAGPKITFQTMPGAAGATDITIFSDLVTNGAGPALTPNAGTLGGFSTPAGPLAADSPAAEKWTFSYTPASGENGDVSFKVKLVVQGGGAETEKTFTFPVSSTTKSFGATEIVPSQGGTVGLQSAQIHFPAYAVIDKPSSSGNTADDATTSVPLTIVQTAATTPAAVTDEYEFNLTNPDMQINPDSYVEIAMAYDSTRFDGDLASLRIEYYDGAQQQWRTDGITNIRVTADFIIFQVNHFTKFRAVEVAEPAATELTTTGDGKLLDLTDCFVATACAVGEGERNMRYLRYKSGVWKVDESGWQDMQSLRGFRDFMLQPSAEGRAFLRAYQTWGPVAAEWIAARPWARTLVRWTVVKPAAAAVRLGCFEAGFGDCALLAGLASILLALRRWMGWRRRRPLVRA